MFSSIESSNLKSQLTAYRAEKKFYYFKKKFDVLTKQVNQFCKIDLPLPQFLRGEDFPNFEKQLLNIDCFDALIGSIKEISNSLEEFNSLESELKEYSNIELTILKEKLYNLSKNCQEYLDSLSENNYLTRFKAYKKVAILLHQLQDLLSPLNASDYSIKYGTSAAKAKNLIENEDKSLSVEEVKSILQVSNEKLELDHMDIETSPLVLSNYISSLPKDVLVIILNYIPELKNMMALRLISKSVKRVADELLFRPDMVMRILDLPLQKEQKSKFFECYTQSEIFKKLCQKEKKSNLELLLSGSPEFVYQPEFICSIIMKYAPSTLIDNFLENYRKTAAYKDLKPVGSYENIICYYLVRNAWPSNKRHLEQVEIDMYAAAIEEYQRKYPKPTARQTLFIKSLRCMLSIMRGQSRDIVQAIKDSLLIYVNCLWSPVTLNQFLFDFPYADLRALHFSEFFSLRSLAGSNMQCMDLSEGRRYFANLSYANLAGANLRGASLAYCKSTSFHNADLSSAQIWNTNFLEADLTGAIMHEVTISFHENTPAIFANFAQANLKGSSWLNLKSPNLEKNIQHLGEQLTDHPQREEIRIAIVNDILHQLKRSDPADAIRTIDMILKSPIFNPRTLSAFMESIFVSRGTFRSISRSSSVMWSDSIRSGMKKITQPLINEMVRLEEEITKQHQRIKK